MLLRKWNEPQLNSVWRVRGTLLEGRVGGFTLGGAGDEVVIPLCSRCRDRFRAVLDPDAVIVQTQACRGRAEGPGLVAAATVIPYCLVSISGWGLSSAIQSAVDVGHRLSASIRGDVLVLGDFVHLVLA